MHYLRLNYSLKENENIKRRFYLLFNRQEREKQRLPEKNTWRSLRHFTIDVLSIVYLGHILHDIAIAASSLFYTPARQNVTTLELLISKPFICGDEQRHEKAREKNGGVRDDEKYQGSKD